MTSIGSAPLDPEAPPAPAWRWAPWVPLGWAGLVLACLGVVFVPVRWPFVDVYEVFYKAYALPWSQVLPDAFGRGLQYRPAFTLLVKAFYDVFDVSLWPYKVLIVLQHAAILGLFAWTLGARTRPRALAAVLAVTVVMGLHSSRILFAFFPIGHHSLALLMLVAAVGACLDGRLRRWDWALGPLALVALLFIELGAVLPVAVTALWLAGAPGVSRRGTIAVWIGLGVYVAVRLSFGQTGDLEVFSINTGLGFTPQVAPERLRDIFVNAPWWFLAYNVVATTLSVLVSEPRAGVYQFIQDQLEGRTAPWQYLHVLSSLVTSVVVIAAVVRWRRASPRDRLLIVAGATIFVAGCGLGFEYARDRMGLVPGFGYAMILYVAAGALLERAWPSGPGRRGLVRLRAKREGVTSTEPEERHRGEGGRRAALGGLVLALFAVWLVRVVEAGFVLRDTAWESHLEWTARWEQLSYGRSHTDMRDRLRATALAKTPPNPECDPAWTYAIFERNIRAPRCPD